MINTNAKQTTEVPDGNAFKRSRVQLTKPVQTYNTGRVSAEQNPQSRVPIVTGTAGAATPSAAATAPVLDTDAQAEALMAQILEASKPTVEQVDAAAATAPAYAEPSAPAVGAATSTKDQARDLISRLSDEELGDILDEISRGGLRGGGTASSVNDIFTTAATPAADRSIY